MRPGALEEDGGEELGDGGADVDGEVKPIESTRDEMGIGCAKLVTHMGGDAGLDAASTEGDEAEAKHEACAGVIQGQDEVPGAIDEGEGDDGAVFAEPEIGKEGSEKRGEIDGGDEEVGPFFGLGLTHEVGGAFVVHQGGGHEDVKDGAHAIEAEALGELVADDVGDARRHVRGVGRSGAVVHGWRRSVSSTLWAVEREIGF